jgi:APA family basic amino acid/polyamine antiporter
LSPSGLVRGIGLFDATALVVGSMIGSGIFIVSAESARVLGATGWLLAAWAIAGLMTMTAALSCAELAAMLPRAGGQYVFFREAYGPMVGFLFGWAMFLVIQTGTIAAVSVAFAKFLGVLWPAVSSATPLFSVGKLRITSAQLVALAVIALLTATNATGLRTGTRTQNVFTTAKLAALLGLTALGLAFGGGPGTGLRSPGFWSAGFGLSSSAGPLAGLALVAALGVAMVGPLFSQSAWNNVTFAGEEIRRPERTLPLALLIGCLIVTLLYVLANIAYANVLSLPEIAHAPEDRVATAVATRLFGAGAAAATAAAIMISTFGCV